MERINRLTLLPLLILVGFTFTHETGWATIAAFNESDLEELRSLVHKLNKNQHDDRRTIAALQSELFEYKLATSQRDRCLRTLVQQASERREPVPSHHNHPRNAAHSDTPKYWLTKSKSAPNDGGKNTNSFKVESKSGEDTDLEDVDKRDEKLNQRIKRSSSWLHQWEASYDDSPRLKTSHIGGDNGDESSNQNHPNDESDDRFNAMKSVIQQEIDEQWTPEFARLSTDQLFFHSEIESLWQHVNDVMKSVQQLQQEEDEEAEPVVEIGDSLNVKLELVEEQLLQLQNERRIHQFSTTLTNAELDNFQRVATIKLMEFEQKLDQLSNGTHLDQYVYHQGAPEPARTSKNVEEVVIYEGSGEEEPTGFNTNSMETEKSFRIIQKQLTRMETKLAKAESGIERCQQNLQKSVDTLETKNRQNDQNLRTLWNQMAEDLKGVSHRQSKSVRDYNKLVDSTAKAANIAKVIKTVQRDHYSEIQRLKKSVNVMETDILRFGLKLTTLQADFLNSTLYLYQESRKDMDQDIRISKLIVQMVDAQDTHESILEDAADLRKSLSRKVEYSNWNFVTEEMADLGAKLTAGSSVVRRLRSEVERTSNAVVRLEITLPTACRKKTSIEIRENKTEWSEVIKPVGSKSSKEVACQLTDGQYWTILQRRDAGELDFNKTWDEYAIGFGDIRKEFWLGNEFIHLITNQPNTSYILLLETWDIYDKYRSMEVTSFRLASEKEKFRLYFDSLQSGNEYPSGNYMAPASNQTPYNKLSSESLEYHNGLGFSAYDKDFDTSSTHCARYHASGWWFGHCQKVNLNGNHKIGMLWFNNATGDWIHLRKSQMKIRPSQ